MCAEFLTISSGRVREVGKLSTSALATSSALPWPSAAETLCLGSNQIHVWCARLDDFHRELPRFQAMLSSVERMKSERFRFPKDHDSYVIRHGLLRMILGRYLEKFPSEIEFCYGQFGKPQIKEDPVRSPLHFNDSHSGDLVLYAVTRACPIGVDVEQLRAVPYFEEIASRFFSPREAEMLMALPTECRMEGFFACWTRKEAFLKATGEGISERLAKVEVTLAPWEEAKFLRIAEGPQAQAEWQLRSFSPATEYLAAVAFKQETVA